MRIIEQFCQGKRPDQTACEDRLLITDHHLAVIDGATSKTGRSHRGRSEGGVVADAIAAALEVAGGLEPGRQTVDYLSAAVEGALDPLGWAAPPRPNAVIAVYSEEFRAITRVGDVGVLINGQGGVPDKQVDRVLAETRALAQRLGAAGAAGDPDPARSFILPLLARQYLLQNHAEDPFGFGCIDGAHVPDRFIEVIGTRPGDEVVLCSDGYVAPAGSLSQTEARLAALLARDPERVGDPPGTKAWDKARHVSFDDRTYLRFAV